MLHTTSFRGWQECLHSTAGRGLHVPAHAQAFCSYKYFTYNTLPLFVEKCGHGLSRASARGGIFCAVSTGRSKRSGGTSAGYDSRFSCSHSSCIPTPPPALSTVFCRPVNTCWRSRIWEEHSGQGAGNMRVGSSQRRRPRQERLQAKGSRGKDNGTHDRETGSTRCEHFIPLQNSLRTSCSLSTRRF